MASNKAKEWLESEKLIMIEAWARDGLIDEQIAHNMGINRRTLSEWKKKYEPISHALKKGKEVVDAEVENALLKRALGYTIEIEEDKIDKDGCVHTLKKQVHIPGETLAQIFWLKNRKPKEWRDKVEVKNDDNNDNSVIKELTEAIKNVKKD